MALRTKHEFVLYKRTKQVHIYIYNYISYIALILNVCEIGVNYGCWGR